jgi:hypothetical protein
MLIDLERYTRLARIQKRYYITIALIKNIKIRKMRSS